MNKLLPCPFCGSEAEVIHNTYPDYEHQWYWTAECTSCSASVVENDEMEAIKAWNKRFNSEQLTSDKQV